MRLSWVQYPIIILCCFFLLSPMASAAPNSSERRMKRYKSFIRRIQRQLKRRPASPRLYTILGRLFQKTNQNQKAKQAYLKALLFRKNYSHALVGMAHLFLLEKKYSQAQKLLQKVLRASPNHPSALAEQSEWYRVKATQERHPTKRKVLFQKAIQSLERAIAISPRTHAYHYRLGILNIGQHQYFKSHVNFSRAVKLYSVNPCYRVGRHLSESLLTRKYSGIRKLRRWYRRCSHRLLHLMSQEVIMAYFIQRSQKYVTKGRKRKAILEMRKAISLAPLVTSGYFYLAILYSQVKDCKAGRAILKRLLRRYPNHLKAKQLLKDPKLFPCKLRK